MNEKQHKAIKIACEGHNLLILGSAGTGKSLTVREIQKRLESTGKNVKLTCSTGIACQLYENASTVHSFTGISDGRYGPSEIVEVLTNTRKYDKVVENIKQCDVVIVDECSMISRKTFDIIYKACSIRDPAKPFGGLQVIFVGDFFQLPPVANMQYDDDGSFCFQSDVFTSLFPHRVVLEEIFRQQEKGLIKAIHEVYLGNLSAESENLIRNLNRPLADAESDTGVKLFSRNDFVDDFNRQQIMNFPGPMYEFKGNDSGQIRELSNILAPHTLWLKKDCPVILIRNMFGNLVNGLRGTVQDIDDNGPIIHFPSVNTTIRLPKVKFTVFSPRLNKDVATREQYPLKLAFSLSIHKAQGMTLSRVEIDCREIFKAGQLGVAMSRATQSDGLRIINFHPRYVIPPPKSVTDFMKELTGPVLSDLTCCMSIQRRSSGEDAGTSQTAPTSIQSDDLKEPEQEQDSGLGEEEFDDDFDSVIQSIISEEEQELGFDIPEDFDINTLMKDMKYKKEMTKMHTEINEIISRVQRERLTLFVKKTLL